MAECFLARTDRLSMPRKLVGLLRHLQSPHKKCRDLLAEGICELSRLKPDTDAFRNHHLARLIGRAVAHIVRVESATLGSQPGGQRIADIGRLIGEKAEIH